MIPDTILAVDPGKKVAAAAYFIAGKLADVFLAKGFDPFDTALVICRRFPNPPTVLVTEGQQIYPGRGNNPNDLLPLAFMAGAVHGMTNAKIRLTPLPRQWKGSVKKEIFTQRTIESLTDEEAEIIDSAQVAKGLIHNIFDAFALGKWALKEMVNR